jgi:hypothetical protein
LVTACALASAACSGSSSNGGNGSSGSSGGNGSSGTGSGSSSGGTGSSSGTTGSSSGVSGSSTGSSGGGSSSSGTGSSSGGGSSSSSGSSGGSHIQTIFLILMENNSWSSILGSSSAQFINGLLTDPEASYATNYFDNPSAHHPSEPNYVWLEAATDTFSDAKYPIAFFPDGDPTSFNSTKSTVHLATMLTAKGVTWREYAEDISGNDCPIVSSGNYATKHVPFLFFQDIVGKPPTQTPTAGVNDACKLNIRPYTELAGDLMNNRVAQYNFITPNLCNDMHSDCGTGDPIKQGDDWLSMQLGAIRQSSAYKNGGAIFITWDESENYPPDAPIGMIVLSPLAKGHGHNNSIMYYHSSMVRTVEEVFGLTPLIADAANQPSLSDLFATYP